MAAAFIFFVEISMRLGIISPTFTSRAATKITLNRKLLFKIVPRSNREINSRGYRDREFDADKGGKKRILFLGDSFVYGIGVPPEDALPKMLEMMLGEKYEVINMGVYSFGPDQSLIQLLDEGLALNPDMVVLGLFAANDFNDILKNKLFYSDDKGRLRENPENAVTSRITRFDFVYLFKYLKYRYIQSPSGKSPTIEVYLKKENPGEFRDMFEDLFKDTYEFELIERPDSETSRRKMKLMRAILRRFKAVASEKRMEFLVAILPSYSNIQNHEAFEKRGIAPDRYFVNEDIAAILCESEKVPYVNLSGDFFKHSQNHPLFDDRFDHHFSIYGNFIAASGVYTYIKNKEMQGPENSP